MLIPQVLALVSPRLEQADLCALVCVNSQCRRALLSHAALWKVLSLQGMPDAGRRLVSALTQTMRYDEVEEINLEFGQDVQDSHLEAIFKCKNLRRLNLNACQKISNAGVKQVVAACPEIEHISLYWNMRITDTAVGDIVGHLKTLRFLNLSGCKNVTDKGLRSVASHCPTLRGLNLTRCVRITDDGLTTILNACRQVEELYLYALSGLTPKSLTLVANLQQLKLLELTGVQELTNPCLASIGKCLKLESLNLTWCVKITDEGLKSLTCPWLQLLSLHGILGITDKGLEHLSGYCAATLVTIDVNGCMNVEKRSKSDLVRLFPRLKNFQVHS